MSASLAHSVARNTTVMMTSQMATWASSFILMLFLPRMLGSEEFGRLFLAVSVTAILQIAVEFGGGYYIAKEIARDPGSAPSIVSNSIAARSILWILAFAAMIGFAVAAGYTVNVMLLLVILGVAKLWEGSGKVFNSSFQGLELMQYPSIGGLIEKVFVTAAGVAALMNGAGVLTVAAIMAASTVLNVLVQGRYMLRIIPSLPLPEWEGMKSILRKSSPYFLWAMFSVVYYRVDVVMLSLMVPENVVGWYGVAYRFFDILMFLPSIFSTAIFPVLSKLWEKEGADLLAVTTQKGLLFIFLAGVPLSIGVFFYAPSIIEFFFGSSEFAGAPLLLRIFSVGLLLVYVDFVLGTALFASERQRQWTAVAFCAMLLNPLLNYFLIPYTQVHHGNGGIGAALATLITEAFVLVMALVFLPASVYRGIQPSLFVKGLASGGLMTGMLFLLQETSLPWMVSAVSGAAVYLAGLIWMNVIEPAERVFLSDFFSVRNIKSLFATTKGVPE